MIGFARCTLKDILKSPESVWRRSAMSRRKI